MGRTVTSLPVSVFNTTMSPLRQATNKRWFDSSNPIATGPLHLVTGQLATTSRLSRSTTSTWLLSRLLTYILGLDFSSAMASSVSPSILISASFLPAVVSTTLSMEYVWWTSPPPLSMYRYLVVGSYPIESASSSSFTLDSRVYVLPSNILRSPASPSVT